MPNERLYKVSEIAELFSMKVTAVEKLVKSKALRSIIVNGYYRIRRTELLRYIEELKKKAELT
jgi:excisionase family DNA binding protein